MAVAVAQANVGTAAPAGSGTSFTITLSEDAIAGPGRRIIVGASKWSTSIIFVSVADNDDAGRAWQIDSQGNGSVGNPGGMIASAPLEGDSIPAGTQITVTLSGSHDIRVAGVSVLSGVDNSDPVIIAFTRQWLGDTASSTWATSSGNLGSESGGVYSWVGCETATPSGITVDSPGELLISIEDQYAQPHGAGFEVDTDGGSVIVSGTWVGGTTKGTALAVAYRAAPPAILWDRLSDESDITFVTGTLSGGSPGVSGQISFIQNDLGGTADTTSVTGLNVPSNAQVDDLMEIFFSHRGTGGGTVTDNSGDGVAWTRKGEALYSSSAFSLQHYYKRVTAAMTPGSTTISVTGLTNAAAGVLVMHRGVIEAGDPYEAWLPEDNHSTTDETHSGIETLTDNAWVGLAVGTSPDTSFTFTSPLIERAERLSTGGTDAAVGHASFERAIAGVTGTLTYNLSTNTVHGVIAYVLKPTSSPATPSETSVARVSLAGGSDPGINTGHVIRARPRKVSGTGTVLFNAAIYEGINNRSGDQVSSGLTTSFADVGLSIPEANAANIGSYADLEYRFWATSPTGDNVNVEVAKIRLDVPDAGIDTTPPVVNLSSSLTYRMSDESGNDFYSYSFTVNEDIQAWKAKIVSNVDDPHTSGTEIESGGAVGASTPINGSVTYSELVAAGVGTEGDKRLKFFAQDLAGNWSV